MRLYRGLKEPFDPSRKGADCSDFTDCAYTALTYAAGRRGVVLVVDVPDEDPELRQELWLHTTAKRYQLRGAVQPFVTRVIPAKDLRAVVRRKGVVTLPDIDKSMILRRHLERLEREPLR